MRSVQRNARHNPAVSETTPSRRTNLQRRGFLLSLGIGGAGAAALAVRTLSSGAIEPGAAREPDADGTGYQVTEHVRRYYQTVKL